MGLAILSGCATVILIAYVSVMTIDEIAKLLDQKIDEKLKPVRGDLGTVKDRLGTVESKLEDIDGRLRIVEDGLKEVKDIVRANADSLKVINGGISIVRNYWLS